MIEGLPSGLAISEDDLRKDLARMRQSLDPEGKDRALDDMVFVGHSMGGLISRLMTIDGGEDFWKMVSPRSGTSSSSSPMTWGRMRDAMGTA